MDITSEFYDWFNSSAINRMHLIPCWLAWEKAMDKASEKKPIMIPVGRGCMAPCNCDCGYMIKPKLVKKGGENPTNIKMLELTIKEKGEVK